MDSRDMIAKRAVKEIRSGQVINLGIGIPTRMLKYMDSQPAVLVHSENGILGMGPHCDRQHADRNLIDAGGGYVGIHQGAAFFDSVLSFALIRGGRLDISFLGALEVSQRGDLANWKIPGKHTPGIGGGMELAQKSRRVVVTTLHTNSRGLPKIRKDCRLPLTAKTCVRRIITELAVIDVQDGMLVLKELSAAASVDEVVQKTEAPLIVPDEKLPRF